MSSHREAPEISKDPVADNADVYAFVSPDSPTTVTIISNFVPLQGPAGGPNFFEFGDDVLYSIYIDNDGDAMPEIEYQFQFSSTRQSDDTFLYNTGPITSLTDAHWNSRQLYSVTRIDAGNPHGKGKGNSNGNGGNQGGPAFSAPNSAAVLGTALPCPPCNIGPLSTPNYETALGSQAVKTLPTGEKVFCGQRADPFYVDLGSIFDLGNLRPLQQAHAGGSIFPTAGAGVNGTAHLNIHTIAIQVPISMLTSRWVVDAERVEPDGSARHLERRQPAEGPDLRRPDAPGRGLRALGSGVAARQPALQRGDRPTRQEGRMERRQPRRRCRIPAERAASRARRAPSDALPGCLPQPGGPGCVG